MTEQLNLLPFDQAPGVRLVEGSLWESRAQTWVNPVNCRGVMGAGLALGFKRRFPEMFLDYQQRCRAGQVRLGQPYLYRDQGLPWVLNFPTKDDWRQPSQLAPLLQGLDRLQQQAGEWGISSLAVPALGCGLGQLDWREVRPLLQARLERLGIPVELYPPH